MTSYLDVRNRNFSRNESLINSQNLETKKTNTYRIFFYSCHDLLCFSPPAYSDLKLRILSGNYLCILNAKELEREIWRNVIGYISCHIFVVRNRDLSRNESLINSQNFETIKSDNYLISSYNVCLKKIGQTILMYHY